jgi:signal transduction histidine kinase
LGLILGHATFLFDSAQNDTQRNQLEVIIRSATRLKRIIEDLSNISQTQRGVARVKRKPIAVKTLIARVLANFQDAARRKRISLSAKLPESELSIEGDEEKIALALSNLLANAISFTNDHGHVLVSAEKLPGYVKMAVVDDGIGIPAKDLPRVFERFFQVQSHLTRRHGGMGLGLSVAKAMIELHGGEIWAESIEGKGSNFSFLLPQKEGQSLAIKPVEKKQPEKVKAFVEEA